MAEPRNVNILDLPYEIHKQIFDHLSLKEVEALLKTNNKYIQIWEEINNSIADKTIFDSGKDSIDDNINNYKNIREINIRTMVGASADTLKTYLDFATRQKKLRRFQMQYIMNFCPIFEIGIDVWFENLTELNISFIRNRSNAEYDFVHIFLERAPNLQKFIYECGHLADASLIALIANKNIREIVWTNVLILNPRLFRNFLWNAHSLRKFHIIDTEVLHVDQTLSMIESIFIRLKVTNTLNDVRIYFRHFDINDDDANRIGEEYVQVTDIRCNNFIDITNIVSPLLKKFFTSRLKLSYIRRSVGTIMSIEDGLLEYSVHDFFQQKYKTYSLHFTH